MVEQFSSFVQEALEFLSLLRASEKERFETEKKFMNETMKILKELAASINKNNSLVKSTLEDVKRTVNTEIKKFEDKIGLNMLTDAIKALEGSVDLLQRGSTILEYKFTIQKTREMLDELKKTVSQVQTPSSSVRPSSPTQPAAPIKKPSTKSKPPAPKTPLKPPKPSKNIKPIATPVSQSAPSPPKTSKRSSESDEEDESSFQQYDSVASMMGTRPTRTQQPRRAVRLKKTPKSKIIDAEGGPIEIETGSDDED